MTAEALDLAVIPVSLGLSGIVFFIIAIYLNSKYSYRRGGIKTRGTLIAFRKFEEYNTDKHRILTGRIRYKDYNYNVLNSKPVISFMAEGIPVVCHSEWSVADLDRNDIGKEIPIRYFPSRNGKTFRIILEGVQYEKQREKGRKIMFWVFAGIGIGLIILALLSILLYYFTR